VYRTKGEKKRRSKGPKFETEKRERRWYLCHYLNIISGRRNLDPRRFEVSQPPHPYTRAIIFAVTSALAYKLQQVSDAARTELSRRVVLFNSANFLHSRDDIRSSLLSICFFNGGGESRIDPRGEEGSSSSSNQETSKRNTSSGRRWTNVLLAVNVIMYIAQVASNGRVLTWGAKVNSLIDRGQLWRLATSSVLHANPMHLMINCYSLNSIGPTAESLGGPKRFLAVYLTSAVAKTILRVLGSAMSYWLNKSPSVGASGAIFGLVGSVAVFVMRHKQMVRGGNEDLMQIAQVIALNMTLGLVSRGIDNWGHIGGLLGGTAMAWLVGPQWKYEYTTRDGRRVFLYMLWLVLVLAVQADAAKQRKKAKIPALIVFGDSIMDTGNNNNLSTFLKSNFPPYGKDFPGGLATGRFSDGKVPSDLIAEKLGLTKTLPAYLSPNLKPRNLLKGITFASGGTVGDQLIYFKEYISTIKRRYGKRKARHILNRGIFLVVSSSNDLAHTYIAQSHKYNPASYASFLAKSAVKFVRELHKLGARKIGVFSALPVGCVPLQRSVRGSVLTRECVKPLNNMAKKFNARLSPALKSLDRELDGIIFYVDVYETFLDMIQNPKKYGFEVADRACCGTGFLEISYMCNSYNPFTCSNSSAYIFWDSYHPTERAYQVMVDKLFDKYFSKVNSLIDRGQLWRLATSSVLHANPMHLMVAQRDSLPFTSLLQSQVGSVAVFVMRHKQMVRGGNENLMQIAQISGLLGGTAMAWLVGRHWKFEYTTRDGRRVFVDSVPAPLLLRW
ncbi:hypothetical protein HID58_030508, partial [Brassica napus]